jgi:hypothetical protein
MNSKLKTAALSFGVAMLLGSVAIAGAQTDSVEKSSESHRTETINAAPAPAVVMVQPAPVMVAPAPVVVAAPMNHEHSSSHSTSSQSSPNGDSSSEKSSSSRSTSY